MTNPIFNRLLNIEFIRVVPCTYASVVKGRYKLIITLKMLLLLDRGKVRVNILSSSLKSAATSFGIFVPALNSS